MPSLRAELIRRTMVVALKARRRQGITPDTPIDEIDVASIRAELDRLAGYARLPRGVHRREATEAPVPGEWIAHEDADADRVVLWVHGGAYVMGSPVTHRGLAGAISKAARARVLLPDYRLAPEHPFPEGRDDVLATYRWLLDDAFVDPERLVLGGDSSGGGLALSSLVALRDQQIPLPAACVLLAPWVDLTLSSDGWTPGVVDDPMLPVELAPLPAAAYCGDRSPEDPEVSPLFADLKALPPMLVHVGSDEALVHEATELVERAREAGVEADLGRWEGMWHVFHAFPGFPESRDAVRELGGFIRRHTGGIEIAGTPAAP